MRHPRARRYVVRVQSRRKRSGDHSAVGVEARSGSVRGEAAAMDRKTESARRSGGRRGRARRLAAAIAQELRARAVRELPPRLLALAAEHGLHVSRVSVRNQQWRWGSCSPTGHICLNWRLIQMPASVRDYVMIHELMHLKRMDHSPKFWKLVERACPGYLDARAWLRANQHLLGRT